VLIVVIGMLGDANAVWHQGNLVCSGSMVSKKGLRDAANRDSGG